MSTRLDALRRNCRLVTRVVGEEVLAATIDLGTRLPPPLFRARMVCIPVLVSVLRDQIDREMRCLAVMRGPSINAIAASLDLPFETVRRNVQRMADMGWVEIGPAGGVSMPAPMPVAVTEWCIAFGRRIRAAAAKIDSLSADGPTVLDRGTCDNSLTLAALDLFLTLVGTSKLFDLRFVELLLVQYVANASVAHLNARPAGAAPFARADTIPDGNARAFVPLGDVSRTLGLSRSTIYRILHDRATAPLFERHGNGVRASQGFLHASSYGGALDLIASRTATLFARVERHRCGIGCTALDQALGRPRPWRQISTLSDRAQIG